MRIWHVGALPSPLEVNGMNAVIWPIAREQAVSGHQVALVLEEAPSSAAETFAKRGGMKLISIPASTWRYAPKALTSLLRSEPPDIVHMHSTYLPEQATLARRLVRLGIPYVVTPHGGLNRQSKWLKKSVYVWLVERSRLRNSSAIAVLSDQEREAVRADVPRYKGIVRLVKNPVDLQNPTAHSWQGDTSARKLVFLGRFHVVNKGLDVLSEIARSLPSVEFHMYGDQDDKTKKQFERLLRGFPQNVHVHNPVFGAEKVRVLSNATVYIQTSRWEGFPISIAEAMYLGVPCAVSDTIDLAKLFANEDLGLVLPSNPKEAALSLSEVLAHPASLLRWSQRARTFAHRHFNPTAVASDYVDLYQEVLMREKRVGQV
jgi:glycosyltransferase involved in cell wall biosynthesis